MMFPDVFSHVLVAFFWVSHFQRNPNGLYTVEVLWVSVMRALSYYNLLTKWAEASRIIADKCFMLQTV